MVASPHTSDFVELPGYAEVLKRERAIRAAAFIPAEERAFEPLTIGGIRVRPLTLGLLLFLERMRCAYAVSWKFETGMEVAAESERFVWLISEACELPRGHLHALKLYVHRWAIARTLHRSETVLEEIKAYLADAFYDAPKAPKDAKPGRMFAHWSVVIVDVLAAGGYGFTESEIIAMPLGRLWQYFRFATKRAYPESVLTNPSDTWCVEQIDKRNADRLAAATKPVN